jgi:hypothetical protein
MSQQQPNHRNKKNRNNKNKQNGQRNRSNNKEQWTDKKVPMRYRIRNSKDANSVELKYTDMDGSVDKTKLNVYEDGSDEEFLKLIKEFNNYVDTYDIWDDEHAAHTIYKNFRHCLAGAARDLWDQINVVEEDQARDELTFQEHLKELIDAVLGEGALHNQKEYLKKTPKPEKITVKQWINRIKNINSYLPLMKPNARAFTEEDLINEAITPNIPSIWEKDFRFANLHLKTRIKEIIEPLTVIEEQVKPTNQGQNPSKKKLKNPCRIHNWGHEWDDCRQNPKNIKNDGKDKTNNDRNRNEHNNNYRSREQRRTEGTSTRNTPRSRSNSQTRDSDSDYEYHAFTSQKEKGKISEHTPSSEILVALPDAKNPKNTQHTLGWSTQDLPAHS